MTTLFGQPASPASNATTTAQQTLGMQFSVSSAANLTQIWIWSGSSCTALPTTVALYQVSGSTLIASNTSPSWSGAAGSGWVSCTLNASLGAGTNYRACVYRSSTGSLWCEYDTSYWSTGAGSGGLTSGIISAPGGTGTQGWYNATTSLTYPNTSFSNSNWWIDITVTVPVNAGAATGTGAAQDATGMPAVAATAGLATGTGAAQPAGTSAGPAAGAAAGTGTAQNIGQSAGVAAGLAAAAGTAQGIGSSFSLTAAGLATATGTAQNAVGTAGITVTAGKATGTGTAQPPSVSTTSSVTVNAGLPTGTGTAQSAGTSAGIGAGFGYGFGNAADARAVTDNPVFPGAAAGTGTAQPAVFAIVPGFAPGTGTARDAAVTAGPSAGLATGTGAAQNIGQSASITAGLAHAAATAQGPGGSVSCAAGLATAVGTAFNGVISSVVSPVLTAYGFGSFPQVPVGAVVLSVVAAIVQHGSNAAIGVPSYELWDGTTARIGAVQFGIASTAAGHTDSVVFTGVSYSQLATLQLRMYATSEFGNSGATVSVDAVSLSVSWAPGQGTAVFPGVLAVVPVILPPSASGTAAAAVTPDTLAVVPAFPAPAAGYEAVTVFPGALAVIPVFPHAAAAAGTLVTPGVLAVIPAFAAITDITVPGWATADSSGGSWANPGNIIGPPDGSYAVWTVS